MKGSQTRPGRRQQGDEQGDEQGAAAARGPGLAAAAAPGAASPRTARPPPPARAAASAAWPSVPRSWEPAERSARSCRLWAFPCLIPPSPARAVRELPHGFAVQPRCSAASGTGKKKRVLCLWILAGPEVGALTYPSLHILSSNLQENSASLYSRCQQWAAGSRGNVTTKRETLNLLHPLHSHLYLGKVDNSSFSTSVVVFYARLAFTLPRYK